MPTIISYPAIAIGLTPIFQRFRVPTWLVFVGAFCTIIPDFDVIGFRFGVKYEDMLGHRGLSHSLLFAAALSAVISWGFLRHHEEVSRPACFLFLFLCTASHGVFDALTSGGLGVAFFAPFDNSRYFFPWRPIRVSPLSLGQFLSGRGVMVLLSEIFWVWLPSLVIAIIALAINKFTKKQ